MESNFVNYLFEFQITPSRVNLVTSFILPNGGYALLFSKSVTIPKYDSMAKLKKLSYEAW